MSRNWIRLDRDVLSALFMRLQLGVGGGDTLLSRVLGCCQECRVVRVVVKSVGLLSRVTHECRAQAKAQASALVGSFESKWVEKVLSLTEWFVGRKSNSTPGGRRSNRCPAIAALAYHTLAHASTAPPSRQQPQSFPLAQQHLRLCFLQLPPPASCWHKG